MFEFIKKLVPKGIKTQLNIIRNKGDKYICPYCNYHSKKLNPLGANFNVLKEKEVIGAGFRYGKCIKCGSSDRERLILLYLEKEYLLFTKHSEIKILHVAPEKKLSELILKKNLSNYICGDLYTEGYSYPKHVQNMNVLNLPFEDNHFELIICNHVLEHIENDTDAMREIFRVLKNGGKAILMVPISNNSTHTFEDFSITDPKERELVFGQFDHLRIYGQDYPNKLENVGFSVERINISKKYERYGLNPLEELFIGIKR